MEETKKLSKEEKKAKKVEKRKRRKDKRRKTREEFKKFVFRGNIIDLAVAVAVGSAFTAIVNSFVKDIIGGVMGYFMSDVHFSELKIVLGEGENAPAIKYGAFIENIIYFIIVAVVMFSIIKLMAKLSETLSKLDKKAEMEEKKKQEEEKKRIEEENRIKQEAEQKRLEEIKIEAEKKKAREEEQFLLLKEIRDLLKSSK